MMTFLMGLPSIYFWLFSLASTVVSMSAFVASAAKSIVKRALPLKEIVYLTVSSLRYSSTEISFGSFSSSTWNELSKAQYTPFPVRFVFMKASEGGDFSDTTFVHNFAEARKHGFIRGAYHFYNPKTDANRQADFFIRSVDLEPGDLPPVLDIETRSDDMDKLRKDLLVWLRRIEAFYRVKPILYTSYKYKTRFLNDSIFNTYPYWIAHYYVDSVEYQGPWKFWQHTDVGTLPGIQEQVDLNVFNGSLEELQQMTIPAKEEE